MDTAWFLAALDRAGASQADLARHLRLPVARGALVDVLREPRADAESEKVYSDD